MNDIEEDRLCELLDNKNFQQLSIREQAQQIRQLVEIEIRSRRAEIKRYMDERKLKLGLKRH